MKLLFIIPILFLIPLATSVYAVPNQFVSVQLSNTCLSLLSVNSTTCPSYNDLIQYDTSVQKYSGVFAKDSQGLIFRESSQVFSSHRIYDYEDNWRVFVDPNSEYQTNGKLIIITPNLENFKPKNNMLSPTQYEETKYIIINNKNHTADSIETRPASKIIHQYRYVDDGCRLAYLNAKTFEISLKDTINYMSKNCAKDATSLVTTFYEPLPKTEFNILDSPAYQQLKYWENSSKTCIFEYGFC